MDEPKKQGRGKPQHEPSEKDRAFVKFLAFKSAKQSEIAAVIGVNETTLRERYKDELDIERDKMKATLIRAGYLMAVGGEDEEWEKADPSMNRFMLERFCDVLPPVAKVEQESVIRIEGGLPPMQTGTGDIAVDQAADAASGPSEGLPT